MLRRRVLPIGSFILATEPLPADVARSVMPGDRMCFDTKHLLHYWRLSPDGAWCSAVEPRFARRRSRDARDLLYARDAADPPAARAASASSTRGAATWRVTLDRLPHCGRIDGIAYATGCNGTGVALAAWFGGARRGLDDGGGGAAGVRRTPVPRRSRSAALRRWWLPPAGRAPAAVADRYGR